MTMMKQVLVSLIGIIILYLVVYALAFGFDEGTMNNKIIGQISTALFKVLKFPFVYILPIKMYLLNLGLNILFYSLIINLILFAVRNIRRNILTSKRQMKKE